MSWFGILALIQSLVNQATIGPIVFFVGLMINEETLNFMPSRHYSAYILGLFPLVYDWVTNVSSRSPLTDDGTFNNNTPGTVGWVGILAWKRGALLVSMLWVAMAVNVLDRQWISAFIWALVASAFALFGIIHLPEAGFENINNPTWEQCTAGDTTADGVILANCWDHGQHWMYLVAYLMMAATFAILFVAQKYDSMMQEPIDDETRHAFDDWFRDAAVDTRAAVVFGKDKAVGDVDPTVHDPTVHDPSMTNYKFQDVSPPSSDPQIKFNLSEDEMSDA